MDAALLRAATDVVGRSRSVLSFLVMRNGRLVWERYFNGSERSHAENVHSAAKSLLALAVGNAIEDGHLTLADRLSEHLPARLVPPGAEAIRVRDLLTMSAGLAWSENETEFDIQDADSTVRAVLSQERTDPPGEKFHYSTGVSQVLSAVLTEATGMSTCEYVTKEVLAPIDVTADHWLTMNDGYDAGGHSLFMTPRELTRVGQLVLDEGEDVVPQRWLASSLKERWPLGCGAPSQDRGYASGWWRSDIAGTEVWEAQGYGGQALMVVPSLDMVMVITHDTFGDDPKDIVPITEVLTNFVIGAAGGEIDPDHRCRAFDVYRADLDGTGVERLTEHPSLDLWGAPSPDGETIAFATRRDLNFDVYAMEADGSDPRPLTTNRANEAFPAWSPDGDSIAFGRTGSGQGIYTMRPDGTRERRLTRGSDDTAVWSRDGDRLAFHRGSEDGPGDIRTMTRRGTDVDVVAGTDGGVAPDWSPDDERLAFYKREAGSEAVYVVDAAGGDARRITNGRDPRWLPDGSLVFSQRPSRGDARIVRWSEGVVTTVVDTPGDDLLPIPSADGEWLTFSSASPSLGEGSAEGSGEESAEVSAEVSGETPGAAKMSP
jgi:CubicO group peptidase (beta-lactamase class C family)